MPNPINKSERARRIANPDFTGEEIFALRQFSRAGGFDMVDEKPVHLFKQALEPRDVFFILWTKRIEHAL